MKEENKELSQEEKEAAVKASYRKYCIIWEEIPHQFPFSWSLLENFVIDNLYSAEMNPPITLKPQNYPINRLFFYYDGKFDNEFENKLLLRFFDMNGFFIDITREVILEYKDKREPKNGGRLKADPNPEVERRKVFFNFSVYNYHNNLLTRNVGELFHDREHAEAPAFYLCFNLMERTIKLRTIKASN